MSLKNLLRVLKRQGGCDRTAATGDRRSVASQGHFGKTAQ